MITNKHAVTSCVLGATIVWYDFIVFAMATALVFSSVFFTDMSFLVPIMVFSVGFFARPMGSLLFGHLGDRYGRRPVLISTLILTAVSTVLIGVLPSYATAGIAAPIALLALRLIQAFAMGGELASTSTVVTEHNIKSKNIGFIGSILSNSLMLGSILAAGAFTLASSFGKEALLDWAWRIPFLLSGVLLAVGIYVRLKVLETPEFLKLVEKNKVDTMPVRTVLRDHWRVVLCGIGMHQLGTVWHYILMVFGFAYMVNQQFATRPELIQLELYFSLIALVLTLIYGWVVDRIGGINLYLISAVMSLLFTIPILHWLEQGNIVMPLIFGWLLVSKTAWPQMPTTLTTMFPAGVRQTGSGLVINLSSTLGGGIAPLIAQMLFESTKDINSLMPLLFGAGVLCVLSILYLKKLVNRDAVV